MFLGDKIMKTLVVIGLLALATLTGCTTVPGRPEMADNMVKDFYQRKAPDSGGRLYVTMGVVKTPFATNDKGYGSGEFLIDGRRVETASNNPEFIAIDVPPGQYSLSWLPLSELDRSKTTANPMVVTVQDGDVRFLALDFTSGMNWGMAFGAIGALAGANFKTDVRAEATGSLLEGRKAVSYVDLRRQKP
jgi:hypothetical protein